MTGIFVGLKFENVNYSSEINHADAHTSNTSTRRWFYYIITKIHPPFQNPGSAPGIFRFVVNHGLTVALFLHYSCGFSHVPPLHWSIQFLFAA